jgi:hypothetical protein
MKVALHGKVSWLWGVHASEQVCFNTFFANRVTFMELSSLGRGSRSAIDAPQIESASRFNSSLVPSPREA